MTLSRMSPCQLLQLKKSVTAPISLVCQTYFAFVLLLKALSPPSLESDFCHFQVPLCSLLSSHPSCEVSFPIISHSPSPLLPGPRASPQSFLGYLPNSLVTAFPDFCSPPILLLVTSPSYKSEYIEKHKISPYCNKIKTVHF